MTVLIAGSIVGLVLASEVVFIWAFHRRGKNYRGADPVLTPVSPSSPSPARPTSIDSTIEPLPSIVPPPTVVPHPIPTPVSPSSPPSARVISTLPSNLQRTLSQSSRSAYEEEIERIGSPPPSYRSSRRSDNSGYSSFSSPLPPLPPLPSPLMQPPPVLDRVYSM
ncbi:hypothetical protein EDD85DRAFT_809537 [Armillaria nabsnona]|nr:hypothetical protein EDD85DRAFT_809537 [Armillaria nabsnona]